MLRVLQEQRFERLGSNETLQTHVRVLAATNQDLEKLVEEGRFRKDLYYRLKVVTIQVPPLRDRLDDVAELAHYFLFRFDRELGLDLRAFAPETLELLQNYSWPGNVRELQSAIKQAMLNASGHILLPEFLPDNLRGRRSRRTGGQCAPEGLDLHRLIESLRQGGAKDTARQGRGGGGTGLAGLGIAADQRPPSPGQRSARLEPDHAADTSCAPWD